MRPDSGTTDTANIWGRNAGASFPVEGQRNETWGGCYRIHLDRRRIPP